MKIALNGSTLGPCSLDEELNSAAEAGFELVELRAPKLEGSHGLRRRLDERGLSAWSINSLEGVGDLHEEARKLAGWAAQCGAPYVVCVPGRRRDGLDEALSELALTCRQEGASLAFEFMGFAWSAVRTLAGALSVYEGPVVVDTFHWALGDGDLETLRACDPAAWRSSTLTTRPISGVRAQVVVSNQIAQSLKRTAKVLPYRLNI